MATVVPLAEAVAELVHDGDTVAMEGFTHLIPYAAGHEIIRQGRTRPHPDPDDPGPRSTTSSSAPGCARKLVFSWGGNPGVGSLHRFRDAVREPLAARRWRSRSTATPAWPTATSPAPPDCPSRCCAATAAPTCPRTPPHQPITCPFTGEELTAVPAINPDVAVIHAQRADRRGNVSSGASPACRRRPCWPPGAVAGHRRGDRRRARPGARRDRAARLGDHPRRRGPRRGPSLVRARLLRARQRLLPAWDEISRDRETFLAWMRGARALRGATERDHRRDRRTTPPTR